MHDWNHNAQPPQSTSQLDCRWLRALNRKSSDVGLMYLEVNEIDRLVQGPDQAAEESSYVVYDRLPALLPDHEQATEASHNEPIKDQYI